MVTASAHSQTLERTVQLLQRRWGIRAIRKAGQADTFQARQALPTGFPAVDKALGIGGLPLGCFSELVGAGSAGQLTLTACAIAQAQRLRQQVVYVDVERRLDPELLANCGVQLDELIVLRPSAFIDALAMTEDLLEGGGCGLVVFDCIRAQGTLNDGGAVHALDAALSRWNRLLSGTVCTFLWVTELAAPDTYPQGMALPFFANVRLAFRWRHWLAEGEHAIGFVAQVDVLKNKSGPAGNAVSIRVLLPSAKGARP